MGASKGSLARCVPPSPKIHTSRLPWMRRQGPAVVRECYWDIGRWSDIWRLWRPLPPGPLTLERCMRISQSNEARLLGCLGGAVVWGEGCCACILHGGRLPPCDVK